MNIDYLESAKYFLAKIDGLQPYEFVKSFSLIAIAYALIAIAEKVVIK